MAIDSDSFANELVSQLLDLAASIAVPQVARWSRALAAALRIEILSTGSGHLVIPHYWAVYVNDGRGEVTPRRSMFLVWFRDPGRDPRFSGNQTPERVSQIRRLTPDEWKAFLRENRKAIAAGQPPPMIVARHVGPVSAKRFFENDGGMVGFKDQAQQIGKQAFSQHVKDVLGSLYQKTYPSTVIRF